MLSVTVPETAILFSNAATASIRPFATEMMRCSPLKPENRSAACRLASLAVANLSDEVQSERHGTARSRSGLQGVQNSNRPVRWVQPFLFNQGSQSSSRSSYSVLLPSANYDLCRSRKPCRLSPLNYRFHLQMLEEKDGVKSVSCTFRSQLLYVSMR